MPPISLIAVIAALVPLFVKRKLKHDKEARAKARAEEDE
jgi:hypothetical protein